MHVWHVKVVSIKTNLVQLAVPHAQEASFHMDARIPLAPSLVLVIRGQIARDGRHLSSVAARDLNRVLPGVTTMVLFESNVQLANLDSM